jgi:hypothetical protein
MPESQDKPTRENPPPFVNEFGQFVAAEFVCDVCGEHVSVAFHPAMLADLPEVQRWLGENAPCRCRPAPTD